MMSKRMFMGKSKQTSAQFFQMTCFNYILTMKKATPNYEHYLDSTNLNIAKSVEYLEKWL